MDIHVLFIFMDGHMDGMLDTNHVCEWAAQFIPRFSNFNHDCSFIKDSENVHWKAQGEFWSKHKFHVFVGNCLMNLLLDPFWIHFGTFLGHLLGQKLSRGTPEAPQGIF